MAFTEPHIHRVKAIRAEASIGTDWHGSVDLFFEQEDGAKAEMQIFVSRRVPASYAQALADAINAVPLPAEERALEIEEAA